MIILIHVSIALASIVCATAAFFFPSKPKLWASYSLVATTLASGFYLVVASPGHMVQACTTGLIYIGAVGVAIVSAQHKLANSKAE
jgi:hypothetical protein